MKKLLLTLLFLGSACYADGISSRLNITEADGSPSTWPWQAKFSNGTLTDNGDGTVSITSGGGGSSGIVSPGTFTWVNNFGISASTLTLTNSTSANTLTISSTSTGVALVSVSSAVATMTNDYLLNVSSSNGVTNFGAQNNAHVISSGTTPSAGSCGSSPVINGTDFAFTVSPGATATGCTITFATAYANNPVCQINQQTMSLVNSLTYSHSTTQVVITQTGASSNTYDVLCVGNKG